MRLKYDEAARMVRNRLRPYTVWSVVAQALDLLNSVRGVGNFEQMRTFPWVTLLLVKLALEDRMIALVDGKPCPPYVFDQCRQLLWDAQGSRDQSGTVGGVGRRSGGVYLMFRSLLQAQIPFQKVVSWDFLRWPALIARLPSDHPTHIQFLKRFEIEPEDFICLSYAAFAAVLDDKLTFSRGFFEPLRPRFGVSIDRFFEEFVRDLSGLRDGLRRLLSERIQAGHAHRPPQELVEFPWISNYPILQRPDGSFTVWHPAVFARGMEDAVHKRLSELSGGYSAHFSKVFETYVLEQIDDARLAYVGEPAYKAALDAGANAVEAIIPAGDVNVLVESKLTVYSQDAILSDRAPVVWKNFKRIREAMEQGWLVGERLRGGTTPDWGCSGASEDFLIIVTSQQMSCATGEHFRQMFKRDIFDPDRTIELNARTPTHDQLRRLPLRNIIIVSIDEFEHLMGAVGNGEVDLVPFLREIAAAHTDPKTSVSFVGQILYPKTKRRYRGRALTLARERAEATFLEVLSR